MDFKKYLTENILKFWLDNAIDEEYGGIFTSIDRTGKIYDEEKSVWFQGRALWVFAKAYNIIDKNPAYLDAAKRIHSFLPNCVDTDGRMFFIVTRDGREVQKRRYFFSETFAAIGCAELYKATGDKTVFDEAERYFDTAWRVYFDPTLSAPKFNPSTRRFKALSPVMIMLATAHVMESAGLNSEKYADIAVSMANEILHGGFLNDEAGALLESVTAEGKFSDTSVGRIVNPGHSLEAAWFLMVEGVLRKNEEALTAARKIIDVTMPLGLDKVHGGIIAFTDVKNRPRTQLEWDMKLWWPQCEGIIANRLAHDIFGDEKYAENYNALLDYAMKYMADDEYGEWFGYLHYDNTPSHDLKGNIFKGPFHLPRMCMLLASLENDNGFEKFLR